MNGITKIFSPPVFADDEKTQYARLLNSALWTVMAMEVLILVGSLLGEGLFEFTAWRNGLFIVILLYLHYNMLRGSLKFAAIGLITTAFIHVTLTIVVLGTVRAPIATGYITIVALAGLLFERKGLFITIAASSLAILILTYVEKAGLLPTANLTMGFTQWMTYTVIIGFTANIILIARQISDLNLKRAQAELEIRKKTEETLRIFSRAIEDSPASIVITDVNGIIVSVNPKFTEITGYTQDEALGQTPKILKSGKQPWQFYKELWDTILAGKVWHGIFHNKKKNNDLYWEQAAIAPVRGEDGQITHFVAIKEDITDRKRSEEKLKQANQVLQEKIIQIELLQIELREQATRDSLTKLHNRRYLEEILEKESSRSKREAYPVSLVLLDMDNLKTINDTGGHALGDQAIRKLANHLKHYTRTSDTVCRLGGDEFAVVMPKTTAQDALKRAKEWNKKVSEITLLHIDNKTLHITFTAGVATYPEHGKTLEEVLNYADVALYRAKTKGRNRVELFEE